ncbi:hypothetical protein DL93DRAFT_2103317 [Clavulina sp. PMI_390]|nr:hypothetical protein DL93DRAFT_2103317 [Clavulina sp. PMI_390]
MTMPGAGSDVFDFYFPYPLSKKWGAEGGRITVDTANNLILTGVDIGQHRVVNTRVHVFNAPVEALACLPRGGSEKEYDRMQNRPSKAIRKARRDSSSNVAHLLTWKLMPSDQDTLSDFLKASFDDAADDAAQALMGHGALDLRPETAVVGNLLSWLNRSNHLIDHNQVEELADSIISNGFQYNDLDTIISIAVRRSWITDEAVRRLRAAPPPPWGREDNLSQVLPTLALDENKIGEEYITPLSGRARILAIASAEKKLKAMIVDIEKDLVDSDARSMQSDLSDGSGDDYVGSDEDMEERSAVSTRRRLELLRSRLHTLRHWPVAFYDLDTLESLQGSRLNNVEAYFARSTPTSYLPTSAFDVQAHLLGGIMDILDNKCRELLDAHKYLAEQGLWDGECEALDVEAVAQESISHDIIASIQSAGCLDEFTSLLLQYPVALIALGFMSRIGGEYTTLGLTTTWPQMKLFPLMWGHVAVYVAYMIPRLLAMTSSDVERFSAYEGENRDAHCRKWFFYQPGGIKLWSRRAMYIADKVFERYFVVGNNGNRRLMKNYGVSESKKFLIQWNAYRKDLVASLASYWKFLVPERVLAAIVDRTEWYLDPAHSVFHHFLVIPSPRALQWIMSYMSIAPMALAELQRSVDPLSHQLRKYESQLTDSACIFYSAVFRSPRISVINPGRRGDAHLAVLSAIVHCSGGTSFMTADADVKTVQHHCGPLLSPYTAPGEELKGPLLPGTASSAGTDAEITRYSSSIGLIEPNWLRLFQETAIARNPQATAYRSHLTQKQRLSIHQGAPPPDHESRLVKSVLEVSSAAVRATRDDRSAFVCNALVAVIVITRWSRRLVYGRGDHPHMLRVRQYLVRALEPYGTTGAGFQFPDCFSALVLSKEGIRWVNVITPRVRGVCDSVAELDQSTLLPQEEAASYTLQTKLNSSSLKFLQDIATLVARGSKLPRHFTFPPPESLLPPRDPYNPDRCVSENLICQ